MRTRQTSQAARLEHLADSPAFCDNTAVNDRQAATEYAILIAPSERGWRWQVIDQNGVSVAGGLSADQSEAMDCAQRAIELCA